MVRYIALILLLLMLTACTSETEASISDLKPQNDKEYSIIYFAKEKPLDTKHHNETHDALHSVGIDSLTVYIMNESHSYDHNYEEALDIESYPLITVFDKDGLALKTTQPEELENFLSK